MEPLIKFKAGHGRTKTRGLYQEGGFYIIDPVLELTATGRYSVLKKVKQN